MVCILSFQDEIDTVIIIGGGTRVPKIQEILLQAVGKWDNIRSRHVAQTIHVALNSLAYRTELGKNLNADEAVALGAVYQGAGHSKMFRVKKFLVKEGTVFPIQVLGDVVTTISICLGIGCQRCWTTLYQF